MADGRFGKDIDIDLFAVCVGVVVEDTVQSTWTTGVCCVNTGIGTGIRNRLRSRSTTDSVTGGDGIGRFGVTEKFPQLQLVAGPSRLEDDHESSPFRCGGSILQVPDPVSNSLTLVSHQKTS